MSLEFGNRIRAARGFAGGKSQQELAEALEMSDRTFKEIELGRRKAKRSELLAIAEACEVPLWFLERGWEGWRGSLEDDARHAVEQMSGDERATG